MAVMRLEAVCRPPIKQTGRGRRRKRSRRGRGGGRRRRGRTAAGHCAVMIMEGDEMELNKEELARWTREVINKTAEVSIMQEQYKQLKALLRRRQNQAALLQKLTKSVAACEVVVKKQYSLLGWEYKEIDSNDNPRGSTPPFPQELAHTETQVPSSSTTNDLSPQLGRNGDSENCCRDGDSKILVGLKRPVVVLNRLPLSKICSFLPPVPQDHDRKEESFNILDSDSPQEPQGSSDSHYSDLSFNTRRNKRRKMGRMKDNCTASPEAKPDYGVKSRAAESAGVQSSTAKNTGVKDRAAKASTPQANAKTEAKSKRVKTVTNSNGETPAALTLSQSSHEATKAQDPPRMPQMELTVNTNVLARRRAMGWQKGKVVEMVTKEDGRLKYKIAFEDQGRSLISGHHIAFQCLAKATQLFVGARVLVRCETENPILCPGIVAELPCRKNHARFLVFLDDRTPVYVGLPSLHLVCKPLPDPCDDIFDETYKNSIKEYIKAWPAVCQYHYQVGDIINVELDGVVQVCKVLVVDCSVIQVVFQENKKKDWIYRGSIRLEENIHKHLKLKKKENSTTVNKSSKSAQ